MCVCVCVYVCVCVCVCVCIYIYICVCVCVCVCVWCVCVCVCVCVWVYACMNYINKLYFRVNIIMLFSKYCEDACLQRLCYRLAAYVICTMLIKSTIWALTIQYFS